MRATLPLLAVAASSLALAVRGVPTAAAGLVQLQLLQQQPVQQLARTPVWIRHYNASVAPPRCGDINIEPLFPIGISDETIQRYASNSIEDYSAYVLELGECGKSYTGYEPENHSWPVINMTKRNNPPSLGAPWFTRGNKPGGGIPGLPGTSGNFFQLCVDECVCSSTGQTIHSGPGIQCPTLGCPPCTDANCKGRCELCSPSFNKKLEGTMINLWCDPSDPDCKNGRPSRPVPPPSPTPSTPAAANATCTASGCNFYFECDEDRNDLACCANGTRGPGCFGICPDTHCGQVDAAPSMPKKLFEPQYAKELAAYIKFTQGIQIQDPFCGGYIDTPVGDPNPKLGTCASQGYKYTHANEPGRRVAWGGFPHGLSPDFGPSTVLQKACLANCGCCMNTSVLYNPGILPECAADAPKKSPMCTECSPSGCDSVCALCAPSFNAERDIDFYFTTKVQNVCELRDGGGLDPTCSAATTPLACLAHPLKCAWRTPTATGTCISTGTTDGTGPDSGKKCCSIFSRGPTCGFDCNTCRAPGVNTSKYGGREFFSQCCDQCEICLASGNGTIATEATCGKPRNGDFSCAWQKNK